MGAIDRLVFVGLYRFFPRVPDALAIGAGSRDLAVAGQQFRWKYAD